LFNLTRMHLCTPSLPGTMLGGGFLSLLCCVVSTIFLLWNEMTKMALSYFSMAVTLLLPVLRDVRMFGISSRLGCSYWSTMDFRKKKLCLSDVDILKRISR
jgi:hypothetical protein